MLGGSWPSQREKRLTSEYEFMKDFMKPESVSNLEYGAEKS